MLINICNLSPEEGKIFITNLYLLSSLLFLCSRATSLRLLLYLTFYSYYLKSLLLIILCVLCPDHMKPLSWLRLGSTICWPCNGANRDVDLLAFSQVYSSWYHVEHHVEMPNSTQIEGVWVQYMLLCWATKFWDGLLCSSRITGIDFLTQLQSDGGVELATGGLNSPQCGLSIQSAAHTPCVAAQGSKMKKWKLAGLFNV